MRITHLKMLFIAFLSASAVTLFAQEELQREKKTVEEMVAVEMETTSARLKQPLTSEQIEKIAEINLEFTKKIKDAKDRKASSKEFRTLYKSREDSLKLVLTPELFSKWKEKPVSKKIKDEINNREVNLKK